MISRLVFSTIRLLYATPSEITTNVTTSQPKIILKIGGIFPTARPSKTWSRTWCYSSLWQEFPARFWDNVISTHTRVHMRNSASPPLRKFHCIGVLLPRITVAQWQTVHAVSVPNAVSNSNFDWFNRNWPLALKRDRSARFVSIRVNNNNNNNNGLLTAYPRGGSSSAKS